MPENIDNLVQDNKYQIPYLTGNHTFADWASFYNTLIVNKLNLIEVFRGASGDGIVFTLGTTSDADPVGGATSGYDLSSGTFRCDIAETIARGVTFQGDVNIDGTLNYDFSGNELSTKIKLYSDNGFTGTKGFTFGMPVRVAKTNPVNGEEGCSGDATYYLGKADSINNAEVFGVVSGVTWPVDGTAYSNSNTWIEATLGGKIKGDFSIANDHTAGLSAGVVYFLSSGTSGGLTPVEPTVAGQVSKPMILGITADEGVVLNYRGQFLQGSGTGGTGGINDNRFIVAESNAELVRGVVAGYNGENWILSKSPDKISDAVGLVVDRFTLDGTTYIEIVSCGHVNDIQVVGGSQGLLYIDSNGKLSSVAQSGGQKPFAVVWPDTAESSIRRGVIINQNHSGGGNSAKSTNGNWAFRSATSGGTTYGSAINNNIMINGAFDVWQRGIAKEAVYGATGTTYFADRWVRVDGLSGAGTTPSTYSLQRQEFAKNQTNVFGNPKYYLSSTHTTTGSPKNGDRIIIQNRIEDVRTTRGQDVTLSFHAKCGITGATMGIVVDQYDGTDTTKSTVANASLGSVWGKYEISFTVPDVKVTPTGKHYVGVGFDITNLNTSFDLAKVKLERGLVATTNPPSNEDEELKQCSKYYQRSYNIDENTHSVTMIDSNNPTINVIDFTTTPMKDLYFRYPVRMYGNPSVTFFSPKTGTTGDAYNRTAEKDLRYTSGTIGYNGGTRVSSTGATTIIAEHSTKDGMYIVVPEGTVLWDQISTHYVADSDLTEDMPNV